MRLGPLFAHPAQALAGRRTRASQPVCTLRVACSLHQRAGPASLLFRGASRMADMSRPLLHCPQMSPPCWPWDVRQMPPPDVPWLQSRLGQHLGGPLMLCAPLWSRPWPPTLPGGCHFSSEHIRGVSLTSPPASPGRPRLGEPPQLHKGPFALCGVGSTRRKEGRKERGREEGGDAWSTEPGAPTEPLPPGPGAQGGEVGASPVATSPVSPSVNWLLRCGWSRNEPSTMSSVSGRGVRAGAHGACGSCRLIVLSKGLKF